MIVYVCTVCGKVMFTVLAGESERIIETQCSACDDDEMFCPAPWEIVLRPGLFNDPPGEDAPG